MHEMMLCCGREQEGVLVFHERNFMERLALEECCEEQAGFCRVEENGEGLPGSRVISSAGKVQACCLGFTNQMNVHINSVSE